ncbi:MAG: Gfo/Idh/MocA family oxidoreductase [Rikenellaceae bacterium]
MSKPITTIVLGASGRGKLYGDYSLEHPDELKIEGIAEVVETRRNMYGDKYGVAAENRCATWEEILKRDKFADAVIISTPDHLHYAPCKVAIDKGYEILLEKPIAQTEEQCRDIVAYAEKHNKVVCLTHVLRYSPYFLMIKDVIDSGRIGEVLSIQHFEPVDCIHFSHSYVRGSWRDSKRSTPFILAKSSHDLDMIYFLLGGKKCKKVQAYGSLTHFKAENAPKGSAERCTKCAHEVESKCPFSALKIYYRDRTWLYVFDLPAEESKQGDAILNFLETTPYGKCVYHCENDQPDHYVMAMEFEGGTTCNMSVEAMTSYSGRRTRIMGTKGDIVGDMETFTVTDFLTRTSETINAEAHDAANYKNAGHGGGDEGMIRDWLAAIRTKDSSLMTSPLSDSLESHLIAFAAERSREV